MDKHELPTEERTGQFGRRRFLATAAIGGVAVAIVGATAISQASASESAPAVAALADDTTDVPEPQGGAGIFDVDPDQEDVTQDPNAVVTGDLDSFSEDEDL
ncbi:MAG: hypothetical protein JWO79_3228 [Actinomycetia bacterium]|jgi:DMSO/TMAO reductase YedYZ molybdopterin-dependent catalytic subunit|nr:hypothetical protein [Actinomycetes bacterium]MDQ1653140.1 hypothetical protein [Cryptosporangiaceae bacterium]MDQ1656111.1 hypothetical protein [Cryptosporangiaceae bacterium]